LEYGNFGKNQSAGYPAEKGAVGIKKKPPTGRLAALSEYVY
jgi:hypothetical protein